MLTGQVPFEADTPLAMLMKHTYETPPSPRSLNPSLPVALEATVLQALAKDPAARYQSASEMAAALERAAARIEQTRVWSQVTELYLRRSAFSHPNDHPRAISHHSAFSDSVL
jgi:serine/threonine protein kinase